MRKTIFLISLLAVGCWLIANSAAAQEAQPTEEITTEDLGVENPGILPSSPFYFLKEWQRGIKKIFTFDPVKKAELELEESNERAAEIKKLEEITPSNIEAITKAATNYQKNIERLKNRLEGLKETSQNPNIDKLLDKLVERSLQHQQLFDNLKTKFEEKAELKEQLRIGQEKIDELITKIPEKFENVDAFKQRLGKGIQNRPEGVFRELRAVEIIDRIKEKLPVQQQDKIQELKEALLRKFESRIEELKDVDRAKILNPEVLKNLPGDQIRRIQILEEMKENLLNVEIGEKIQDVQEKILEQEIKKQEIKKEGVEKMISEIKELIARAEEELKNTKTEIRQSIEQLIKKAKIHLAEAEKALADGKIGEAFGQATSGITALKNALQMIYRQGSLPPVTPNVPCPQYAPISPEEKEKCYKSGGELKVEKDERGCFDPPNCILPTTKTVPDYYKNLTKECELKGSYNCCMTSVKIMEGGGYKLMPETGCPKGYQGNGLECIDSYGWCEPIK